MRFRFALALLASVTSVSDSLAAGENVTGQWSSVYNLPLVPSSAAILPNGKALLWSANGEFSFSAVGQVHTTVFDPATGTNSYKFVEIGHNMFCTGTTNLPDGRILVNGGNNSNVTSIYNPVTDTFTRVQNMNVGRGYNSNTLLPDGSVFTFGGSWSGALAMRIGELWTETGGWKRLSSITTDPFVGLDANPTRYSFDSHFWLKPGGNGRIFFAGPAPQMHWIDTTGSGSVEAVGPRGDDIFAINGISVMYDTGKILVAGGSDSYTNRAARSSAYHIDITGTPTVDKLTPMNYARGYHNSVVLPDGKVLIIGGQSFVKQFSDTDSVLATEIWDPATRRFSPTAPITVPRNYHSIAILLPDGRVLAGGGGLCGTCTANHPDVQIYSPGYLFNADGSLRARPAITNAPTDLPFGRTITVTTDRPVSAFSLVRYASTTHTVNNDQRRLSLTFRAIGTNTYEIDVPSNTGYLLPGNWMLFALDGDGTPSVAHTINAKVNPIGYIMAPRDATGIAGRPVVATPTIVTRAAGVTFGASNLPDGLSVDPQSGVISGIPTSAGTWKITLTATNGDQIVSTDFMLKVDPAPPPGTGLLADYFAGPNLGGAIQQTAVELPDRTFAPAGSFASGGFSARWSGMLYNRTEGTASFRLVAQGAVRFWLDGRLLVDRWDPAAGEQTFDVDLPLGGYRNHRVLLEYGSATDSGRMSLSWIPPGSAGYQAVPAADLYPSATLPVTNVATGKVVSQSTTASGAVAGLAIDGGTDGAPAAATTAATDGSDAGSWQIDLAAVTVVDRLTLWAGHDTVGPALGDFTVFLSSTDMTGRSYAALVGDPAVTKRIVPSSGVGLNIDVPGDVTARFVRIQRNATGPLRLAEVQVFGRPENRVPTIQPIPNQLTYFNAPVNFQVVASDPEGGPLTYSMTGMPFGVILNPATGLFGGYNKALGTFRGSVTVRDSGGLTATTPLTWVVVAPQPIVSSLPVSPVPERTLVTYRPTITNGTGVTYSWSFGDGSPATPFSTSSQISRTFMNAGIYGVTLTMRTQDGQISTYRFDQAVYRQVPAGGPAVASAGVAYEPRPGLTPRLWIPNPDNNSVGVVDVVTKKRVVEFNTAYFPVAAAMSPLGEVWVVNRNSWTISIIKPAVFAVNRTVTLPRASQPSGIVFAPNGRAYVSLEAIGQIAVLDSAGTYLRSIPVGASPRGLAVTPDGSKLLVSNFITPPLPGESTAVVRTVDASGNPVGGRVDEIDLATETVTRSIVVKASVATDSEASGRGIPNYLGSPAISPDGSIAWVPSKQDNVFRGMLRDGQELDFQTTVRAVASRIDLATGQEDPARRIDLDNASVASAAVFHPTGAYLFVALQTSREVAVVDPVGRQELFRFTVGRAPSSLIMAPDGKLLFVINFMDRSVTLVDLAPLLTRGQKAVTISGTVDSRKTEKLPAAVFAGKRLFYDAADQRLARDGYMSCATCHDDAKDDGRVWDFTGFGEGLRNTVYLRGRVGTSHGFLHWSANFDEVQDFEGQIRNFAGGTGLMSDAAYFAGTRSQPLGDPKAGVSVDLDNLAAYVASIPLVPDSPWRTQTNKLTAAANLGKGVFTRLNCAQCHAGTKMTISGDASQMRDVGTLKPSSGQRLGGPLTGIDVPTLLAVFTAPPYMHDGSAATLTDAINAHQGITMNDVDRANLAEYLRQIGPIP